MKPGNHIKAKLFAMYLNQKVLVHAPATITSILTANAISSNLVMGTAHLLLRPIDLLTDEEIKHLFILLETHHRGEFQKEVINNGKNSWLRVFYMEQPTEHNFLGKPEMRVIFNLSNDINSVSNCRGNDYWRTITRTLDYLRSIGIATTFTYLDGNQHPTTATVTEQVEWGWVKLISQP